VNLHEYQAKNILLNYGIKIPEGRLITKSDSAVLAAKEINTKKWIIKAQAHTGERKKAGGIVIVEDIESAQEESNKMFQKKLITQQSGRVGLPVDHILIEEMCAIKKEYYIGILIDRTINKVVVIGSESGGTNIEMKASDNPDNLKKLVINIDYKLEKPDYREFADSLNINPSQTSQFEILLNSLVELFHSEDASLVEINPLIVDKDNNLIALDAKISIDPNALFRHDDLRSLRDIRQENELESRAIKNELNFIALEGDIGCMVNGAGLAMATMDLVQQCHGNPANFLDVGGGVTAERVKEAFKIITFEKKVKAVLVNIFGGIVRCDYIAIGIIEAIKEIDVRMPIIVRLEGTNANLGLKMLKDSGLTIETAKDLTDAAERVVKAAKK
tara:strand:+ start:29377 stop:30540 length:1164 start_codon:yes stop_codon:yes gene_type:complete